MAHLHAKFCGDQTKSEQKIKFPTSEFYYRDHWSYMAFQYAILCSEKLANSNGDFHLKEFGGFFVVKKGWVVSLECMCVSIDTHQVGP